MSQLSDDSLFAPRD